METLQRDGQKQGNAGFRIRRGTTISHLFVDETPPASGRNSYFTEMDIRYIQRLGFDHVRIPISEMCLWSPSGEINEEMFSLLDEKVSACIAAGLRVIVCLHFLRSHPPLTATPAGKLLFSNPGLSAFPGRSAGSLHPLFSEDSAVEVFCRRWREISRLLRHHLNDHLAYELFNEPFSHSHDDWNRVWRSAYSAVRDLESERILIIGSNLFQIPPTIKRLDLPVEDANILASFHFYYPDMFTHYRAKWQNYGSYAGTINYPGRPVPKEEVEKLSGDLRNVIEANNQPVTKNVMRQIVRDAVGAAAKSGHRVYCGEFGCIDSIPVDLRVVWLRDIVEVFEEHGVPWTQWDWKGQFGVLDRRTWRLSGVEGALGLQRPRWGRLPRPSGSPWFRLRRKVGRLASNLKLR